MDPLQRIIRWATYAVFAGVCVAPVLYMFGLALAPGGRLSLGVYREVFAGGQQLPLLLTSCRLALQVSLASLLIGLPIGWLLARTNVPGRPVIWTMLVAGVFIPPYISTIAWIQLLGTRGLVSTWWLSATGSSAPWDIYSPVGVTWALTLTYFPLVAFLSAAAAMRISASLEEAALTAGHSPLAVFRRVTLPLVLPGALAGAAFVFILALAEYGVPSLLRITTYPVEVFTQFAVFYDFAAATATCLPLLVVVALAYAGHRLFLGRSGLSPSNRIAVQPRIWRLGRARALALGLVAIPALLATVVPLVTLAAQSGGIATYAAALRGNEGAVRNTLLLGLIGAAALALLALPLAYFAQRESSRLGALLDAASWLLFAVPGSVLGIGMIRLWNRPATELVYGTSAIVLLAYLARFGPICGRLLVPSVTQVSPDLEEAARVAGIGWLRRFAAVVVPQVAPGLAAVFLIGFALCAGELGSTILVAPPGSETLPMRVFSVLANSPIAPVAALCVVMVLTCTLPVAVLALAAHRSLKVT